MSAKRESAADSAVPKWKKKKEYVHHGKTHFYDNLKYFINCEVFKDWKTGLESGRLEETFFDSGALCLSYSNGVEMMSWHTLLPLISSEHYSDLTTRST